MSVRRLTLCAVPPPVQLAPEATKAAAVNKPDKPPVAKQKVAKRRARTKKEREDAKGGKAGHPGRFHGEILDFLMGFVGDYNTLPTKENGERNKALARFWNSVQGQFWERFTIDDARATFEICPDTDEAVIEELNDVSESYRCS